MWMNWLKILAENASGCLSVYDHLRNSAVPFEPPEPQGWAISLMDEYENKMDKSNKIELIKKSLKLLYPSLEEDFELVEKNFFRPSENNEKEVNAGIAMRNLLEHFKGRLIQKSSIKGKAWEAMMKKLSKFPENSYETYTLIDQEKIFTNLFGQLSNLAKQCKKGSTITTDINHIYTELIEHLYIIFDLIVI